MIRSTRGSTAAALLCLFVAACGGGGSDPAPVPPPPPPPPTALPASVSIASDAQAETGADVAFSTSLTITDGVTFLWNFGDGTTGADAAPHHAYAHAGTYEVTVSLANTAEELRAASFTVTVGAFSNVKDLECTGADGTGWCWQNVNVTPHAIAALSFVPGTSQAWAVGEGGAMVASADGGDTWKRVASGVRDYLGAVRFRDADHGIVLSDAGYALRTADGGATWTRSADLFTGQPAIIAYDATHVVVSAGWNTFVSTDEGSTWTSTAMPPATVAGTNCWWVRDGSVATAANCTGPVTTVLAGPNDGGKPYFSSVSFSDPAHGMALSSYWDYTYGQVNQTWTTADGGQSWVPTASNLASSGYGSQTFQAIDATHAYLVDPWGTSWLTTDAGATWNTLATWSSSSGVVAHDDGHAASPYALWTATTSTVSITSDYGQNWQAIPSPEAGLGLSTPTVVQWPTANDAIIDCDGRYYATHDAGQTWKRVLGVDPRDVTAYYAAIWFTDAKHGLLALGNGALESTADGGRSWTRQDYPTAYPRPVDLQFSSATEGWMMLGGTVWHSTDAGASWSQPLAPAPMRTSVVAMSWPDAAHGWVSAPSGCCDTTLYATGDGGRTWNTQLVAAAGGTAQSVVFEDANTGMVVTDGGTLLRTTDAGATWAVVRMGLAGVQLAHTGAHTLWAIGAWGSNFLLRSTDGGASWSQLMPPMWLYGARITGMDDAHVWIGSWNTVFSSTDNGDTWTSTDMPTDGQLTALFALDAATLWGSSGTGQVLTTATGGH
jgi:photosystem II stability/assembly factor-like uncharacterized protein